jgi:hypothetical protein
VIRQAISCDICGTEKKQTNHWFVACDQGGELRLSGWSSRNRLRPGSKHLCGQTCLHKLVDDFMARALSARDKPAAAEETTPEVAVASTLPSVDTSLTANAAFLESESSARLIAVPDSHKRSSAKAQPELVPMPARLQPEDPALAPDEPPRFASRNWRAEAWDRERERALHGVERNADTPLRRRSGA